MSFLVCAETWTSSDGVVLAYYDEGDGATITRCTLPSGFSGGLEIPSELDGNPIRSIEGWAFEGCSGLTSVTIPDSVTSIGDGAFDGCESIRQVEINCNLPWTMWNLLPDSYTSVTNVVLGPGVTSITDSAFDGCSGLTSFEVAGDNPHYSASNGLLLSKDGKALICGVNGGVTIPDGVTHIGESAFAGCESIWQVEINCELIWTMWDLLPDSYTSVTNVVLGARRDEHRG